MKNKEKSSFIDGTHVWGRMFSVIAIVVLMAVPVGICVQYDAWPTFNNVFDGLKSVALIFWTAAILEITFYGAMLGPGASYLSFVTGNTTNLKLPCVLSAREIAKTKQGTDENEVVSTIAAATSTIVTTVILAVGVIALSPVLSKITSPESAFSPAFNQVLPALFGALGAGYFAKHWKISILPIAVAVMVLAFSPKTPTGTLIPICVVVAILGAYAMYISGFLTGGVKPENPIKLKKK